MQPLLYKGSGVISITKFLQVFLGQIQAVLNSETIGKND